MGLFRRSIIGVVLALAAYAAVRTVLYDVLIVQLHQISRENTAGKRVLITGSSRGVGEALARVYAEAGANVAVHARSAQSLQLVAEKCKQLGASSVHKIEGDMSQPAAAEQVVSAAAEAMQGLDIVIVNHISPSAFTTLPHAVAELKDSSTARAMQINLFSYMLAAAAALPHLQLSAGSLVLVSSAAAKTPIPYCYEYCFSKRALEGLFSSLRQELAMNGSAVHVGIATLGLIDTEAARIAVKQQYKADMSYASRESTARDIAALPLARVRELATPWYIRFPILMRELAPESIEGFLRGLVHLK